jgi:hypothetical protein
MAKWMAEWNGHVDGDVDGRRMPCRDREKPAKIADFFRSVALGMVDRNRG